MDHEATREGQEPPPSRREAAEAWAFLLIVVVLVQAYWVFVLDNYVRLLEFGGRSTVVVAEPEVPGGPSDSPGSP